MTDEPVKKQEFKEETTKAEQDKDELTEDETSALSGGNVEITGTITHSGDSIKTTKAGGVTHTLEDNEASAYSFG